MLKALYKFLFGDDKFKDEDFFRYEMSQYLLDSNNRCRRMSIYLNGAIR